MEYKIENILISTDFSETADNALCIAAAIAQRHRATIHILNIVSANSMSLSLELRQGKGDEMAFLIGTSKRHLESIGIDLLKKQGVNTVTCAEYGDVSANVCAYAVNNKIDMVIMGSHGTSGWKEFLIGSNVMSVIKECHCPVLTIPLQFKKMKFDRLLYPVRNVKGVVEKYDYIKKIAEINDAEIHLLGLIEGDGISYIDLLDKLKQIKDMIKNDYRRVTFKSKLCHDIVKEVMDSAIELSADIVVINAEVDGSWMEFFTGNFTQQIVNHSAIPVLSVKINN